MSKSKLYLVTRASYVYDDEYYNLEQGVIPERGFTDRGKAEEYARRLTIRDFMDGLELGLYSYSYGGVAELTSLDKAEAISRLSSVLERYGYTVDRVDELFDSWEFSIPSGLTYEDAKEIAEIFDKYRPYQVEEVEMDA